MHELDLPIAIPPMLEQALGYAGDADLVGFYWEPAGDEVVFDDTRSAGTGNWHAWVIFSRHAKVAPHLAGFELGSSDATARHWFVLNRRRRRAGCLPVAEARRLLRSQWPPQEPVVLSEEEVEAIMARIREAMDSRPMPTQKDILEAMASQHEIEKLLRDWLDQADMPGRSEGRSTDEADN